MAIEETKRGDLRTQATAERIAKERGREQKRRHLESQASQ